MAIHHYIADRWCPALLGTSDAEKAKVDMLAGVLSQLKQSLHLACYQDTDKDAIGTQSLKRVKEVASFLEGKDYLLGEQLCYLDFYMFELV